MSEKERSARIAALNDAFGKEPTRHGRAVVTRGVNDLGPDLVFLATRAAGAFNDFTEENDPYGEHDFGSFDSVTSLLEDRLARTTRRALSARQPGNHQPRPHRRGILYGSVTDESQLSSG